MAAVRLLERAFAVRTELLAVFGAGFVLGACSPAVPRVPRIVGAEGGLIYSNTVMLMQEREPQAADGSLRVDYAVLFENCGNGAATIDLASAQAQVLDAPVATHCRRYRSRRDQETSFELAPGKRVRIECALSLSQAAMQQVALGDRDLWLTLPLRGPGLSHPARFVYYLRLEDAR